jgi:hypothetical protein
VKVQIAEVHLGAKAPLLFSAICGRLKPSAFQNLTFTTAARESSEAFFKAH